MVVCLRMACFYKFVNSILSNGDEAFLKEALLEVSLYSAETCEKMAKAASLRYVSDSVPGISRKKNKAGFIYYYPDGRQVLEEKVLQRINALAIPPAYHDVWICPYANGHIQATARDDRNRKQYRYHSLWQECRQQQKFYMMISFGKALTAIREHVNRELRKPATLSREQIICAIIYLLDNACLRIGNSVYARENKSYGLTTLRKKHLSIEENKAMFDFEGKSSKIWHIDLKDRKIVKILKKCEEIPGYELFKYYDENGALNVVCSQEINAYLQTLTKKPFTAKDFRTWIACRETLCRLVEICLSNEPPTPKNLKSTIKEVADLLGHTTSVCQKNYIYPGMLIWWQQGRLHSWVKRNKAKIQQLDDDSLLLYWLKKACKENEDLLLKSRKKYSSA
nr:DNA topoisomerase IB [Legionella jordanis]